MVRRLRGMVWSPPRSSMVFQTNVAGQVLGRKHSRCFSDTLDALQSGKVLLVLQEA
jgi:hypothetical protein